MEMKKYKLGDLIDVSRGKSLAGEFYATSGNLVRLTMGNFDYINNCFKQNTSKDNLFFSGKVEEKFILNAGDIITPLTEQTPGLLGSTARIPESGKYIQSQDVALVRCKKDKLDEGFAYYLISSESVKKQLGAAAQQTKIRHTSPDKIKDCTVYIPEISIQKKIGNILSTLDKRMENLRAQNRVLEQTAKTIYDYTFLQCAGHQTTYNKTLNRNIPADWEVKSVNQMAKSYRGVAYDKSDVQKENNGGILVLRGNNIQDNNLVYDGNVVYIPENLVEDNQHIKKGDIIMTMSSGSKEHIGKCTMFQYDSKHTYGAFLTKFTPNRECRYYFYMNLISDYFKAKIKSVCNGTGINNLTNQTFNEIFFPYPDSKTLDVFEKTVTPIFDKMGVNTKQIETLTTQRNTLLPLLMTGQVVVKFDKKI